MTDQALHGPMRRVLARRGAVRPGREASVAIVGSVAFHALVLGYLALRGLSGPDAPWSGPISDPMFPYGSISIELVELPSGEGRPVRLNRVRPHDKMRWLDTPAERSPDFHLPEPGRTAPTQGVSSDAEWRSGQTGPGVPDTPGRHGAVGVRPAPFNSSSRTSTLACRNLARTLTLEEQAVCDERFIQAASGASRINGTGDPARDARFAAEGAAALARYEQRRLGLKPNSRANPCPEGPNPSDPCAFAIQGRIWSDREGWFPDLPGKH